MRKYLDKNDKKNQIRLLFKHPSYKGKVIIVVEGGSDVKLFRGVLNYPKLGFESIDGKKDLLEVMASLIEEYPGRIIGLCDADFDNLKGVSSQYKKYSVYATDYHDAEMMMLNSPAIEDFLSEYSNSENIGQLKLSALEKSMDIAYIIGVYRRINDDQVLNINFKGLNYNLFMNVNKLDIELDVQALLQELIRRSPKKKEVVSDGYLRGQYDIYSSKKECRLQICRGHDVSNILAMIYRQKWSSDEKNMDCKKVESALRIAYRTEYFSSTSLGAVLLKFLDKAFGNAEAA